MKTVQHVTEDTVILYPDDPRAISSTIHILGTFDGATVTVNLESAGQPVLPLGSRTTPGTLSTHQGKGVLPVINVTGAGASTDLSIIIATLRI